VAFAITTRQSGECGTWRFWILVVLRRIGITAVLALEYPAPWSWPDGPPMLFTAPDTGVQKGLFGLFA
jgi:hypothetical protein